MSHHQLQSEIEIKAPADRVWAILTDFAAYPEWNPFIRSISGALEPGARLEARLQPSGASGMTFRPTVLVADPARELKWLGHLLLPGIFDGEHRFTLEPLPGDRVLFHQSEQFNGLLVPLFRRSLDRDAKRGFEEMNRALKARAEGG
jgi:hypothetical protein